MRKMMWPAVVGLMMTIAFAGLESNLEAKTSSRKMKRQARKVITKKRITDHKTAYSTNALDTPHVDVKVTPPGPRGKDGIVLVEVYNRSKIYLQTVRFEIELNNNGWDRLNQTITVDAMEAGGSTKQELKLPTQTSKSAAYSIKDVKINRIEMYSYDATPVRLNYSTDLILR